MQAIGTYMAMFGIGSMILHFFDREFVLLTWIDSWGTDIGWVIRFLLVIVGVVLGIIGARNEQDEDI